MAEPRFHPSKQLTQNFPGAITPQVNDFKFGAAENLETPSEVSLQSTPMKLLPRSICREFSRPHELELALSSRLW